MSRTGVHTYSHVLIGILYKRGCVSSGRQQTRETSFFRLGLGVTFSPRPTYMRLVLVIALRLVWCFVLLFACVAIAAMLADESRFQESPAGGACDEGSA